MPQAEYLSPTWMQFDPAQRINQAIQSSRQSRDQEIAQGDRERSTEFEEGREQNQDAIAQQEWQEKVKGIADQQARWQKYQGALDDIQAHPEKYPNPQQAASLALLNTFGGTGAAPAAAIRALTPPKPQPTFQPLTMPGTEPTAATAATPAADNSLPPMPPEWTPPTSPQASPAPLTPPTSPNSRMVHPAGTFNGKYVPAQFAPEEKPVTPPRPLVLNPSQIAYDSITHQPFATNTIPRVSPISNGKALASDKDFQGLVHQREEAWKKSLDNPNDFDAMQTYQIADQRVKEYEASKDSQPSPKNEGSKPLDKSKAAEFLKQADGDKDKARKLARDAGYTF